MELWARRFKMEGGQRLGPLSLPQESSLMIMLQLPVFSKGLHF